MSHPDTLLSFPLSAPDEVIGSGSNPYLRRWHLIRRARICNVYLHHFLRSDDDRALHDHPWWNASILLRGSYIEHIRQPNGSTITKSRKPGAVYFRRAIQAHRVELLRSEATGEPKPVWTLFITGPKIREWGFLCPQGWKHWRDYVHTRPGGNEIGEGCGE